MADPALSRPPPSRTDDTPVTSTQIFDTTGICRICRGEGTPAEPLFYPCKCSGSIKYVHQDCLMEWLSHSQKKHCELCKTSFRFTKLYAPDMPTSLPLHIFLQHMTKYILRNAMVWLRAGLAISVWIFFLPYFMRSVWSFMFWVSDEGLVNDTAISNSQGGLLGKYQASLAGEPTCPASPLFIDAKTPMIIAESVVDNLASQPVWDLLKRVLLHYLGFTQPSQSQQQTAHNNLHLRSSKPSIIPSLLSDVAFIGNMTGNGSSLHQTIVSVLEGQIITILVILSFILVILVRDYVIQQQPELDMAGAFAAQQAAPPVAEPNPPRPEAVLLPNPDNPPSGDDSDSDDATLDDGVPVPVVDAGSVLENGEPSRPQEGQEQGTDGSDRSYDIIPLDEAAQIPSGAPLDRNQTSQEGQPSVVEYLRLYRQADGNPHRFLQIVEEEGMQERLSYWVDITKRSLETSQAQRTANSFQEAQRSDDGEPANPSFSILDDGDETSAEQDHATSAKGKEKEDGSAQQQVFLEPLRDDDQSIRPRAKSDGHREPSSVNPLANNTWTFDKLPRDDDDSDTRLPQASPNDGIVFNTESRVPGFGLRDERTLHPSPLQGNQLANPDATPDGSAQVPEAAPPNQPQAVGAVENAENPNGESDAAPHEEPANLVNRVADLMWGNLEELPPLELEDEADDEILAAVGREEPGWMNVAAGQGVNDIVENAAEDANAALAAGLDADAIDDMDDFDGIMELIGMRGPVAGLFQNAIFCAVLVSATVLACIFFPYNIGRIALWATANPMRLVRLLFELSKLIQDFAVCVSAFLSWCVLNFADILARPFGDSLFAQVVAMRKGAWSVWISSASRVAGHIFAEFPMSASEMQNFSAVSHEALNLVKGRIHGAFGLLPAAWAYLQKEGIVATFKTYMELNYRAHDQVKNLAALLVDPSSWVIDLTEPERTGVLDHSLASWGALDRFWAILAGYASIFAIGALYLKRRAPFTRDGLVAAWEAGVIDTLLQASGIMKVIIIISIEMLAFPLYCGLLLDVALLPLFEGATLKSRLLFTCNFPLTSVFVHWFIGTGYMFHFALFVSMCRKIMRPGVLYFIRDPDDPEFHPVRDVLERNLTTQLRKILFSAFVYGALVIVCLGGVVWGLSLSLPHVLPIHYSSNEPVLEFPVDLLFYNFLMPLAVNFFKPSDGLHIMYTWWFRKCSRALRLTYFLFGERRIDEEGQLQMRPDSSHANDPIYRTAMLELDDKNNEVVPKTWSDTFEGGKAKPNPRVKSKQMRALRHKKAHLVETGQLVKSGRFVRAPASDRVKIPKGKRVFLTVTERDDRMDDRPDDTVYASNQYQVVYIPPHFRTRIFTFILMIWIFAAVTGVGLTIIPLTLGRLIFKELIPSHIRTNDIYAFSIGIYVLGTLAYGIFHMHGLVAKVKQVLTAARTDTARRYLPGKVASVSWKAAKLVYVYFFVLVVAPLVASALVELYFLLPLNTYLHPPAIPSGTSSESETPDRHTIRIVQAWTLGLLYLKLTISTITSLHPGSRLSTAIRSVLRNGWLHPDAAVLTRGFVIPGLALSAVALFGPYLATTTLLQYGFFAAGHPVVNKAAEALRIAMIYRRAYPVGLLVALTMRNMYRLLSVFQVWTSRIRDEAYLIGERLHNFGAGPVTRRTTTRAFRAGGPRL